jgi:hypothetical protein
MNFESHRIPKYDCFGNRLKIGDKAIIFSERGVHYEGAIQQIGGKRWFVVDEGMKIGGIGSCSIMKKVEEDVRQPHYTKE